MTPDRNHFGPPYTDAELAEELAAEGTVEVTPELEELGEHISGTLPGWRQEGVRQRLATDTKYREWARPLLALEVVRPRAIEGVTSRDLRRLEQAIERSLPVRHGDLPPGEREGRRRFVHGKLVDGPDDDLALLSDFLAGRLSSDLARSVERRLASDPSYRAWVSPLATLAAARPRAVNEVTPDAVAHLEQAIARALSSRPARDSGPQPRPHLNLLVRVIGRVGFAAIFAIAAASVVRYRDQDPRHSFIRPTVTSSPLIDTDLVAGGRYLEEPEADADGARRATAVGPLTVTVTQPPPAERAPRARVALRLVTRDHLVEIFEGQLIIAFDRSGRETLTMYSPGKATYRLKHEGADRLRPLPLTTP